MQPMVPVVGATGTPLMPTTHRRANRLIARGRALRRFDRGLYGARGSGIPAMALGLSEER
jgi:hypothetical protein